MENPFENILPGDFIVEGDAGCDAGGDQQRDLVGTREGVIAQGDHVKADQPDQHQNGNERLQDGWSFTTFVVHVDRGLSCE